MAQPRSVDKASTEVIQDRGKGANLPGVKVFFDTIESLVSAEEGTLGRGHFH